MRNTPDILYHCSKCGERKRFFSTHQFRVNAQRQALYIWLIYQCISCKSTYKLEIMQGVRPQAIDPNLLDAFFHNDRALAYHYAFDKQTLQKNRVVADYSVVQPEIVGEGIDLAAGRESAEITLVCPYEIDLRLSSILADKLGLSRSALIRFVDNGRILLVNGDIKMAKILKQTLLEIRSGYMQTTEA